MSAQPFIEELTEDGAPTSEIGKLLDRAGAVTGLRTQDINTAVQQPKKVAYLEQTVRAMERTCRGSQPAPLACSQPGSSQGQGCWPLCRGAYFGTAGR